MTTIDIRTFKKKLVTGCVIGLFSKTMDPAFIEIAGYAGFDFVIIDLEHGTNTMQNISSLFRAAQISGILPIVRVKENTLSLIGEVLDAGASGVQVPQITNKREAKNVIKIAKFAPDGMRGVCRFVRAAEFSALDKFKYFREANESVIVIQLEGQEAVENIDEILEVKGIDIIFIGPYDLAQSMGVSGEIDHPSLHKKMMDIIDKCRNKGIAVGIFVDTLENAEKWMKLGVGYIAYSVDVGIFYSACRDIVNCLKTNPKNDTV